MANSIGGSFVPSLDYDLTGTVTLNSVPIVTTTGTQELTNKTVTAPTITSPTITGTTTIGAGATLTSPTLVTPALGAATATSVTAAGLVKSSTATGGVGYATGAGLTATQASSKSTTVTNAASAPSLCGAITMNNAALNADVIVSFTFTNSAIAATDVLILNHISGGTIGSYTLNAQCAAGSATINVANRSAGNLSEALVIQYVVIKGVNA